MALAIAVGTATILPGFLTGGLSVQIRRDLGFDVSAIGLATGTFFLAAALGSTPGGALAERIGATAAMRAAALASAASLAGVALLARSLAGLLAALFVGGLGNALAQPAINLYIAERRPRTGAGSRSASSRRRSPAPC